MKAKDLTPHQRIAILEDVLRKLENGDPEGGLCYKIKRSAFELFQIQENTNANEIIPILTLENAKRVTEVASRAAEGGYWWASYYFEERIKFVEWMIQQEKLINNINKQTK